MMGSFYILNQDKWTGWEGTVVLQEYLIADDKEDHYIWTLKTYFYGVLGNFARNFTQDCLGWILAISEKKIKWLKEHSPQTMISRNVSVGEEAN